MSIKFTKEINFPTNLLEAVNAKKSKPTTGSGKNEEQKLEDQKKLFIAESLLTVQMLSFESEVVSENLTSWQVTLLSPKELKLALTFAKPLEVSQGDAFDSLAIFADLSSYRDTDGISPSQFLFLKKELPPQNPSGGEV